MSDEHSTPFFSRLADAIYRQRKTLLDFACDMEPVGRLLPVVEELSNPKLPPRVWRAPWRYRLRRRLADWLRSIADRVDA